MHQVKAHSDFFLEELEAAMASSATYKHPFLLRFKEESLSEAQLRKFAIQWYKTARAHKLAFPALIYNVKDDDVRFELIEILFDEYGKGDRNRIHARLLMRFLEALGIEEKDVEDEITIPAVHRFSDEVLNIWRDGDPIYAFGLHFALEFLAAALHAHFASGLRKYRSLSVHDLEYFNYHEIAEQQHTDYSEVGIIFYASQTKNHDELRRGADRGVELLQDLWDGFYDLIFGDLKTAAA